MKQEADPLKQDKVEWLILNISLAKFCIADKPQFRAVTDKMYLK
ncbi:hypothetical protein [Nostoc commune]|nr:hypothetical protein [Nostoc commune]